MLPTMPTTSRTTSGENVSVKCFPIGSSLGQKRRASASLISAAPGRPAASESLKSRPRTIGICIACRYPEMMSRTSTSGCSDIGTTGRPSIKNGWWDPPSPLSGSESITPADSTPGKARVRCKTSWKKLTCPEGVVNLSPGSATCIVSTFAESKPGFTLRSSHNVRTISPAPISSTSERATSVTTSRLRVFPPAGTRPASPPPRFKSLFHIRAGEAQRRNQSRQHSCQNREQQRERQNLRVQRDLHEPRQPVRQNFYHHSDTGPRQQQTKRPARNGQHYRFRQEVSHNGPSSRPQGGANG